ncbi:MAG: phosphoribosyltransferase family protein [Nanoarchaeota archaeon]
MGIAAINHKEENVLSYLNDALYQINHTGQEHCGIAVYQPLFYDDNKNIVRLSENGLVKELKIPENLESYFGIGAVSKSRDHQPIYFENSPLGEFSIVFDGYIRNREQIKKDLGMGLLFGTDAEIAGQLIAKGDSFPDGITRMSEEIDGCYCLCTISEEGVHAARDPTAMKPLLMGQGKRGFGIISDSRAFRKIGMYPTRDFEPGEIVQMDKYGIRKIKMLPSKEIKHCSFLWGYYGWVDSVLDGIPVVLARENAVRGVAERDREAGIKIDLVSAIEDSGKAYGEGYAEIIGVPYKSTVIKYPYYPRSYDTAKPRRRSVAHGKVSTVDPRLEGKSVVLWDDSLRRGTVMREMIDLIRKSGVAEIHLRFGTGRNTSFCTYDDRDQSDDVLPANRYSTDKELAEHFGVDTLGFVTTQEFAQGILEAQRMVGGDKIKLEDLCLDCY